MWRFFAYEYCTKQSHLLLYTGNSDMLRAEWIIIFVKNGPSARLSEIFDEKSIFVSFDPEAFWKIRVVRITSNDEKIGVT